MTASAVARRGVLPGAVVADAMSPASSDFPRGLIGFAAADRFRVARMAPAGLIQLAALGLMFWSERTAVGKVAYLLAWGSLNCFWLTVLRRPAAAAALSLTTFTVLVLLSRFKH